MNQDRKTGASRRKFLRQIGMTAAAGAAVAGFADVAGLAPALASAKSAPKARGVLAHSTLPAQTQKKIREIRAHRASPDVPQASLFVNCSPTPGQCGGPCHPNGVWCHWCCLESAHCGGRKISCWRSCIGGDFDFCSAV